MRFDAAMLRRPLLAGLLLALLECGLVLATGRELFLSWLELARYAALALTLLPCVCMLGFVLARAAFALIARSAGPTEAAFSARLRTVVVCGVAPPLFLVLRALSSGRRVRDLPGRIIIVGLLAGVLAVALAWLMTTLAREHARAERGAAWTAALLVLAGTALAIDMHVLRRLYPAFHGSLAVTALGASLLAAAFLPEVALFVRARRVGWLAGATALLAAFTVFQLSNAPNARFAVVETAPLSGKLLRLVRARGFANPASALRAAPPASAPADARPGIDLRGRDVLLVTIDALRADRLRAYGGRGLTPGLDALAAQSVVFERAYTPTPHTSYALTSLMTGKYMQPLLALAEASDDQPTLPRLLRRYGYRTAAFYPPAIFYVDPERFEQFRRDQLGFEYVKAMFAPAAARVLQLEQYLRAVAPGHPLFVWVHLFEPHEPYEPLPEYARGDRPVDRYDAEVAAADASAAALVDVFRRARPNATVVVSADHGEEFGEHGGHHHGTTLFDEQVRVPLLWSSPGQTQPGRVRAPVEILDLTTTLLSALGVPRDARMRGDDLGPLLRDPAAPAKLHAFATIAGGRMVCDGRLKLICADDDCRLFDLERDPGERRDIADANAAAAAELRAQLTAFVASLPRVEALALQGGSGWPRALVRARLGDATAATEVEALLASPRADVRAAAARVLGELGRAAAGPALVGMSRADVDPAARAEAAIAALRVGGDETHVAVVALTQGSAERDLAARAALALAARGDFAGERVLIERALNHAEDEPRRLAAIRALGVGGRVDAARALVPLLEEVRLRADVATALGRSGERGFVAVLERALSEDRYPESRSAEARALLALGARAQAVRLTQRFLGTESALPDGVGVLLDAGALTTASGAGADLRKPSSIQRGTWWCEAQGCTPSPGASIVLPDRAAPRAPARASCRVLVAAAARSIRIADKTYPLNAGASELSWPVTNARGLRVALAADAGVWLQGIAVVPLQPDVPPPAPEPWVADEPVEQNPN